MDSLNDMTLQRLGIADLQPHARNSRTHSKKQIKQIADSIRKFGFRNPVLVDEANCIIAGHGRVEAAKLLGHDSVPVVRLEGMSEADKRAYIIADNRLAELAGWDKELLALELEHILELDSSFDLPVIGFDTAEIEAALNGLSAKPTEEQPIETDMTGPVVSGLADIWIMGDHRLICGDATDASVYSLLLAGEQAQMVFTDPPYNVRVNGHICGLGKVKHDEFVMASGEMSDEEFTSFLTKVTGNLARFSQDGSIHFICMDWRHMEQLILAGKVSYSKLMNLIVWNKTNAGMGTFFRSKHELIFPFKNGTAPHINNFELGQHGRHRTNVWDYAGINAIGGGRDEELAMHPTVKPVDMVADAILDCSTRGGIVLDAFSGSGTTIIAAEQTKRRARAIELDPRYVDVAVERWQRLTGKTAVLAGSGLTFAEAREMA
jgi:DNA modification methylase